MIKQLILLDENNNTAQASIEDVVAKEFNKFKGWTCDTGLQSLYIDFDGKVWVGNCASSFSKSPINNNSKWGFLGTIEENFKLPTDSVICPFQGCGCGSDIVVTKYKNKTENSLNFINKKDLQFTTELSNVTSIDALKLYYPIKKQVLWDVSRRCNYNCSYCWPGVHNTTDPHRSLEQFKKTADYLISNWANNEQIRWYFGGGEPTLNPDFEPFIDYLAQKNQWTMLVTNASQGPSYWNKNADNYNILIFSAHFEFMKPQLFANNFKTVATKLKNKTSRLERFIIKLMTKPNEIDNSIVFVNELKLSVDFFNEIKHKITFDMVPLRGMAGFDLVNYSKQELDRIVEFNSQNS
jgi:organic radical activating enzyme